MFRSYLYPVPSKWSLINGGFLLILLLFIVALVVEASKAFVIESKSWQCKGASIGYEEAKRNSLDDTTVNENRKCEVRFTNLLKRPMSSTSLIKPMQVSRWKTAKVEEILDDADNQMDIVEVAK